MAYVVILHLPPDTESNLADILQQETGLRALPATDGVEVTSGTVYVSPPGRHLTLRDGRLRVEEAPDAPDVASVDHLFRSLAADQDDNAVGIILSGSGTDGTLGLRTIKEAGGVTMVHSPADAEYAGMPESALATGLVDLSLPAGQLAEKLVQYRNCAGAIQLPDSEDALEDDERGTLSKIFRELYEITGLDFSNYKRSTILRRLERRLQLNGVETLEEYLGLLQDHPAEVKALQQDLLISVTKFFRDPEAFDALEATVIPTLFEEKGPGDQVRVWVPGCATGEEAYSIAMLLVEHAERVDTEAPEIQVFASDVDENTLAVGRKGLYPKAIEADVSADRLERFFQPAGEFYQINHALHDHVLFAEHNLLEDPPFSDLDLISCRNLLIYLDQTLQEHAYRLLHYALRDKGTLFLGRSGALGPAHALFEPTDASNNILRARDLPKETAPKAPVSSFLRTGSRSEGGLAHAVLSAAPDADNHDEGRPRRGDAPFSPPGGPSPGRDLTPESADSAEALHHQALMEAAASILVAENRTLLHLSGSADRYLQFEGGTPTTDVLSCVPESLRARLRNALYQAFTEDQTTRRRGIRLELEGEPRRLSFSVRPIEDDGSRYAHVRFDNVPATDLDEETAPDPDRPEEAKLRSELQHTREQLRTTVEEYEAATEEMETANEELLSMNEEMQSKNEELETSKEELQSVNEELKSTNQELKAKVEEVRRSKGALENLIEATEIATLFLDRDLCLQRFTPSAADLFELSDANRGCPLSNLTRRFDQKDLVAEAQRAFREGSPVEREVRKGDDEWYLATLRPYRTVDGEITGVVLTLVDISERRLLERELVNATEKVRHKVGQDLHDIVSSDLTALAMRLDTYMRKRAGDDVDLTPLEDAVQRAHEAADQARTLSHVLVPMALQEAHLAAALENLCREQEELSNLSFDYQCARNEPLPRNKETSMHLYRIVQEAITNARRHAEADRIRVHLGRTNDHLEVTVQDDGVGMPDDIESAEGLGLRTMRYRANLIGASLSFESGLGDADADNGTTLRCRLPLGKAEAE